MTFALLLITIPSVCIMQMYVSMSAYVYIPFYMCTNSRKTLQTQKLSLCPKLCTERELANVQQ